MTNKIFLDSNIIIYLYSGDEPQKKAIITNSLKEYEDIVISTQVLFEFTHIIHKKYKIDYSIIEKALEEFYKSFDIALIKYDTIQMAIRIAKRYKYSFADSLIISTAIENGCEILYSEDMHSEHFIENFLRINNPFKS